MPYQVQPSSAGRRNSLAQGRRALTIAFERGEPYDSRGISAVKSPSAEPGPFPDQRNTVR